MEAAIAESTKCCTFVCLTTNPEGVITPLPWSFLPFLVINGCGDNVPMPLQHSIRDSAASVDRPCGGVDSNTPKLRPEKLQVAVE